MWFEPYMVRAEHGFFSARTHLRIDIKNELHNNREVKSMEDKLLEELHKNPIRMDRMKLPFIACKQSMNALVKKL